MTHTFKQLTLGDAQHGLALVAGHLAITPQELRNRTGIEFERAEGDLGEMEVAVLQSQDRRQFGLFRYIDSPRKDYTAIMIDERCTDVTAVLNDVMQSLGIRSSEFISFHPEFCLKPHILWRQDDHGNKVMVAEFHCWSDAHLSMREMEESGHKQTYWVEAEESECGVKFKNENPGQAAN